MGNYCIYREMLLRGFWGQFKIFCKEMPKAIKNLQKNDRSYKPFSN